MNKKGRVIIGMSGGVDSSVSAALLKEQGYDVIGAFILGWTGTKDFPCSWQQEEADARKVAKQLEIPFYTINLTKEYEKAVIDDFFAVYKAGGTPNPDILCNREIKFKALWQAVRQFEPDYLATGHYAKIGLVGHDQAGIFEPKDTNKDQTYFLWGIDKAMLPKILFPLGELTKTEVRALAKKYQLPTATKKDSQGICFVGPLKVRQFLQSQLAAKPGTAVLTHGTQIATHDGAALYTIGQRLGAGSVSWTGDVPPLFVVAKDVEQNLIVVGHDRETFAQEFVADQLNWLTDAPSGPFACRVKIRYRQESVAAKLVPEADRWRVITNEPVRAITLGQSAVFYSTAGELLGGGLIADIPHQNQIITQLNGQNRTRQNQKVSA